MDGFLFLAGPRAAADEPALLKALEPAGWWVARTTADALLLARDRTPVRDLGRVVIVGELFVRGSGQPAALALPPWPDDGDLAGLCTRFVQTHWGRYVIIAASEAAVLRDPSGAMDCLVWESAWGWAAGSDLPEGLPARAAPRDLAIDWRALARSAGPGAGSIGLVGVTAVTPGALWTSRDKAQQSIWRPSVFARDPHGSYAAARDAVRAAVDEVLSAELSSGAPILAEISGGLDSGIVSTTLARLGGGRNTVFINLHAADRASDERRFARAIADKAGLRLLEREKPELTLDEDALDRLPVGVRPSVNGFDHHYDRGMASEAQAIGAGRILTGQGGDIVFFQSPSSAVAGELWGRWRRAPRADPAWRQLEAAARWNRRSVWSMLGEAVREAWRAAPAVEAASHPWLTEPVAPAKRRQIRSLIRAQLFHGASIRGRAAQLIHPLLHQPLQEAVLAAPVIDLARGGQGRGLARDAFADQLPDLVRTRRSKGDLTAYYGRMILRSLTVLRSYLLDGRLATEGVLDRAEAEALLDPDQLIHVGDYPRLFEILALEAYVRHWEARAAAWAEGGRARRSASHGRTVA
ncbi:asparagine synthase (glutamine-hydrolyzing) [Caulobacter rhizosphaerae]|uniref:Asparagine synthase (Glutamine-hydrolyzing) n=1 Tax=Caulobacter rhizosphaerae TaxID=2010972 RepID=A0ABU1MVR9_9CAUL|nr:asparagine synthase C-terminal domain-containing protein [Caulobacter rhizosphaerae]MDR6530269.1 asparagine synthase (glutamine-hydrolyzing) [Caulobacter rhizosphaerae]